MLKKTFNEITLIVNIYTDPVIILQKLASIIYIRLMVEMRLTSLYHYDG